MAVFRDNITDGLSSKYISVELRNKKRMITLLGVYEGSQISRPDQI